VSTKTPKLVIRKVPQTPAEWQEIIRYLNKTIEGTELAAAILAHKAEADPHPVYLTTAEGDAAISVHNADAAAHASLFATKQDTLPDMAGSGNMVLAVNATEDGWQYVPNGGGTGGVTDHGLLTGLNDDDHTQYHTDARGDLRYAPIANSVTNGDTHDHSGGDGAQIAYSSLSGLPTLGTAAATDSTAYDAAGSATTAVSGHASAPDPHPQYLTQTEGDARYSGGGASGYSEPIVNNLELIFTNDGDIVMCIITGGIAYGSIG
jgi:hypothetical protein